MIVEFTLLKLGLWTTGRSNEYGNEPARCIKC
jgi:hypothetical protein